MLRSMILALFLAALVSPLVRSDEPLRVMTFNIRYNNPKDGPNAWPHRTTFVADVIRSNRVDVVGLQEALRSQIDDLRPLLKEYEWYGVGRDDGKSRGEFSPIFYRRDRLKPVSTKTFWLSKTPATPGSKDWDAAITRIATQIQFRDLKTEKTLTVINTHFDHRGSVAREESAKLIASRVADVPADERVVVMGDFNCLPDSKPYRALVNPASQLLDSRGVSKQQPMGPNSTWCGFRAVAPGRRIDFIFVRGELEVAQHATIDKRYDGRFPSDHLPVLATLK